MKGIQLLRNYYLTLDNLILDLTFARSVRLSLFSLKLRLNKPGLIYLLEFILFWGLWRNLN